MRKKHASGLLERLEFCPEWRRYGAYQRPLCCFARPLWRIPNLQSSVVQMRELWVSSVQIMTDQGVVCEGQHHSRLQTLQVVAHSKSVLSLWYGAWSRWESPSKRNEQMSREMAKEKKTCIQDTCMVKFHLVYEKWVSMWNKAITVLSFQRSGIC